MGGNQQFILRWWGGDDDWDSADAWRPTKAVGLPKQLSPSAMSGLACSARPMRRVNGYRGALQSPLGDASRRFLLKTSYGKTWWMGSPRWERDLVGGWESNPLQHFEIAKLLRHAAENFWKISPPEKWEGMGGVNCGPTASSLSKHQGV